MMPSHPLLSVVFKKQVNSMKELYLLMEEEEINAQHSDNKTCAGDSWTQNTVRSQPISSPVLFICSFVLCDHILLLSLTSVLSGTRTAEAYCLITGPSCSVLWGM